MRGRAAIATASTAIALAVTALAGVAAPGAAAMGAAGAGAGGSRPSLPTIERQVMCVTCKIPLNVAESPQADRERAYIQGLIDAGDSEAQIKQELVKQYGPTVLGLPSTHGFDVTAYAVPLAAFVALVALALVLLPRWRRRARSPEGGAQAPTTLSAADTARLDSDLARFD